MNKTSTDTQGVSSVLCHPAAPVMEDNHTDQIPDTVASYVVEKDGKNQQDKTVQPVQHVAFSWTMIGGTRVPCFDRDDGLYVAVRLAEAMVLGRFPQPYPSELSDYDSLTSSNLTQMEAVLLNKVIERRKMSGLGSFNENDVCVKMTDFRNFFKFVKRLYKDRELQNNEGFVKKRNPREVVTGGELLVNDLYVPYVNHEGKRVVPLDMLSHVLTQKERQEQENISMYSSRKHCEFLTRKCRNLGVEVVFFSRMTKLVDIDFIANSREADINVVEVFSGGMDKSPVSKVQALYQRIQAEKIAQQLQSDANKSSDNQHGTRDDDVEYIPTHGLDTLAGVATCQPNLPVHTTASSKSEKFESVALSAPSTEEQSQKKDLNVPTQPRSEISYPIIRSMISATSRQTDQTQYNILSQQVTNLLSHDVNTFNENPVLNFVYKDPTSGALHPTSGEAPTEMVRSDADNLALNQFRNEIKNMLNNNYKNNDVEYIKSISNQPDKAPAALDHLLNLITNYTSENNSCSLASQEKLLQHSHTGQTVGNLDPVKTPNHLDFYSLNKTHSDDLDINEPVLLDLTSKKRKIECVYQNGQPDDTSTLSQGLNDFNLQIKSEPKSTENKPKKLRPPPPLIYVPSSITSSSISGNASTLEQGSRVLPTYQEAISVNGIHDAQRPNDSVNNVEDQSSINSSISHTWMSKNHLEDGYLKEQPPSKSSSLGLSIPVVLAPNEQPRTRQHNINALSVAGQIQHSNQGEYAYSFIKENMMEEQNMLIRSNDPNLPNVHQLLKPGQNGQHCISDEASAKGLKNPLNDPMLQRQSPKQKSNNNHSNFHKSFEAFLQENNWDKTMTGVSIPGLQDLEMGSEIQELDVNENMTVNSDIGQKQSLSSMKEILTRLMSLERGQEKGNHLLNGNGSSGEGHNQHNVHDTASESKANNMQAAEANNDSQTSRTGSVGQTQSAEVTNGETRYSDDTNPRATVKQRLLQKVSRKNIVKAPTESNVLQNMLPSNAMVHYQAYKTNVVHKDNQCLLYRIMYLGRDICYVNVGSELVVPLEIIRKKFFPHNNCGMFNNGLMFARPRVNMISNDLLEEINAHLPEMERIDDPRGMDLAEFHKYIHEMNMYMNNTCTVALPGPYTPLNACVQDIDNGAPLCKI